MTIKVMETFLGFSSRHCTVKGVLPSLMSVMGSSKTSVPFTTCLSGKMAVLEYLYLLADCIVVSSRHCRQNVLMFLSTSKFTLPDPASTSKDTVFLTVQS